MTDLYLHEYKQPMLRSYQPTFVPKSMMSNFYASAANRTLLNAHRPSTTENDDGLSQKAFLVHAVERWRLKTWEHQQATTKPFHPASPYQSLWAKASSTNGTLSSSNEIPANKTDSESDKHELSIKFDESEKTGAAMKKRTSPIPASYLRRKPHLKSNTTSHDSSKPKSLAIQAASKPAAETTASKKLTRSVSVFIPPKRSQSQTQPFCPRVLADAREYKENSSLKRQNAMTDDQSSWTKIEWNPAPICTLKRVRSLDRSYRDANLLDDANRDGSLLLRNRSTLKTPWSPQNQSSNGSLPNCPCAFSSIIITDPEGHSHPFDPDQPIQRRDEVVASHGEDSSLTDGNTLAPNSTFADESPSPVIIITPSTPQLVHEKHTLNSIGEEEEEEEEDDGDGNGKAAAAIQNDSIFSKELVRLEALSRSRQNSLNVHQQGDDDTHTELITRRWSDGVSQPQSAPSPSTPAVPMAKSAASVPVKSNPLPSPKFSVGKYLLMKLHLTSSSQDDLANVSTATTVEEQRTVRRSSKKTRYQTQ